MDRRRLGQPNVNYASSNSSGRQTHKYNKLTNNPLVISSYSINLARTNALRSYRNGMSEVWMTLEAAVACCARAMKPSTISAAASAISASSWTINDMHDEQENHGCQVYRDRHSERDPLVLKTKQRASRCALWQAADARCVIITFSNERKIIKVLYYWLNSK